MDRSKHLALVVEDDRDTCDDLEQILRSLDFEVLACDNRQSALELVAKHSFCIAVLDLQIFGEPGANRGHVAHGRSLLREIRRTYPHRSAADYSFPILVVSGYAREASEAKDVMRDGASDIVWKLTSGGLSGELSSKIRELLSGSGRVDHTACARAPGATVARPADFELSIPGTRQRRRTEVTLGSRRAFLTDGSIRVLLLLIEGHLTDQATHKSDLGGKATEGFKPISKLKDELREAFPPEVESITQNDYNGNYRLIPEITIGTINVGSLEALKNAKITGAARKIAELRSKSDRNS
ncbi:MAG: response regulator [Deltaproteobacteria bacterium]|nr:response regulator [Deltaproteobacteria bacterium]